DPRDPDIPLSAALASFSTGEERADYRKIVEERLTRRSINFTNVRKVKIKEDAKSNFFDIENFAFSYAYSDMVETGFYRANYLFKSYRGNLTYNFNPEPVLLEPFKNMGIFKSPWLSLIKDFNLSLLPASINVRGDIDRRFVKTQLRNRDLTTEGIAPNYEKFFTFNRSYNVRWNFTKNLSFDYMARANAIIDEPEGDINQEWKRDSIWNNVKKLGRMKNFNQQLNFNYRIPFDKIPITDWISGDAQYSVGYTWTAGTLNQTDSAGNFFGHTIQNNREQGVSGKIDFIRLYNKIKFLEEINRPVRRRPARRPPTRREAADTVEQKPDLKFLKGALRTLMAVRSVNITYGRREGTILPGFTKDPSLFGMDSSFNSPGWAFILGSQNPDIKRMAAENNWLTASSLLTSPFTQISSVDLNIRGTIEPFKDLRIQIDMKKTKAETYQEIFRFDPSASLDTLNGYRSFTPSRTGNYMISFLPIRTAFLGSGPENRSEAFENFNSYRAIIKSRLDNINPNGEYRNKAQDVLIPAFLAAYSGSDPDKVKLTPFPNFPLPNWRIDYKGLNNIPGMNDVFSSINLTHSYSSTFSVNGFTSALDYTNPGQLELSNSLENYPIASQINSENELIPLFIMNQVIISERFSPLIGLNFTTKSRINARIEYRKERNVALNMMNSQVTELNNSDFAFSFGFTKANMKLPFKVQGETIVLENDLTFKADFTIRDTRTLQRKIVESDTIPEPTTKSDITSGNLNIVFRPTVNYVLNQRLNLTFYIERNINEPRITNSFARRTSAFGVQVRFSLAQ
ncbi:MAG: cell surface protein SprA, partial [Cyclobacteriaceae bacterium]